MSDALKIQLLTLCLQMNFERKMREMEEEVEGESDDEIRSLKEKLR